MGQSNAIVSHFVTLYTHNLHCMRDWVRIAWWEYPDLGNLMYYSKIVFYSLLNYYAIYCYYCYKNPYLWGDILLRNVSKLYNTPNKILCFLKNTTIELLQSANMILGSRLFQQPLHTSCRSYGNHSSRPLLLRTVRWTESTILSANKTYVPVVVKGMSSRSEVM